MMFDTVAIDEYDEIDAPALNDMQKRMVQSMYKYFGNKTKACAEAGISRNTHYLWMKGNARYERAISEIPDMIVDFAEGHLIDKIAAEQDVSAIKLLLDAQGKHRGYGKAAEQAPVNVMLNVEKISTEDLERLLKDHGHFE
jgi:hypothetical protein